MTLGVAIALYFAIGAVPTAVAFVSQKSSLAPRSVWILGFGMTFIMAAMWLPMLVGSIAMDLARKLEALAKWSFAPDEHYEEEPFVTWLAVMVAIVAATHVARYLWK